MNNFIRIIVCAFTTALLSAACAPKGEAVPEAPDYADSSQWYIADRGAAVDVFYIVSTECDDYGHCHYADTRNDSIRGLLLGEIRNGRFEPSQALAMALKKEEFAQCISFSANDAAIEKYLRGETVFTSAKYNGWVLICVDDYPLGFGKMQNGQIKNKIKAYENLSDEYDD